MRTSNYLLKLFSINMRLLLILLLVSICPWFSAQGQPYQVPSGEYPAYFVYAEGGRADQKLKVLFISKHIIRLKNSIMPSVDVDMVLDFSRIVDKIPGDEVYFNNEPKDLSIWKVDQSNIHGNSSKWTLTWSHFEKVTSNDNSTSAMEKIRESFIHSYLAKGYKVYQIDFNPSLDEGSDYRYLNAKLGKYVHWEMDRVLPLSPLWIPPYKKGDIRELLSQLSKTDASPGSGSITVESKSKDESSSGNNSSGNTPQKKEVKGIGSYCAGNMGYVTNTYDQANQLIYTNDIQMWKKVVSACEYYYSICGYDNYAVNQMYATAKNKINQTNQMYAEAAAALIKDVFTPYTIYGFAYTGLKFKPGNFSATEFQKISFQLSSVKKWGNVIGEFGYVQSPSYVVSNLVKSSSGAWVVKNDDTARRSGGWLSFGAGPSIRLFKNHVIINALGQSAGFLYKKNYKEEMGFDFIINISGGILFRFKKVGIGFDYNYGFLPGPMEKDDGLSTSETSYVVDAKVKEPFKNWTAYGVRLMFNFKVDDKRR